MASEVLVTHRGVMMTTLFCTACRHDWGEPPAVVAAATRTDRRAIARPESVGTAQRPIACRRRPAPTARPTHTCAVSAARPTRCISPATDAKRCGPFHARVRTAVTVRSSRGNIRFVSDNPLIAPWAGPYGGVPPWDRMAPEHFPGAFEAAIAEQRSEIDAIVANREAPTFENTIAAMERAGRTLDRVERMFGVARENVTNPAYQALEREWQPKLAAAADAIVFNQGLFKRIEAVYDSLPGSQLEPDQVRLVTRMYEHFVRRGAQLNAAEKQRLSEINQELAARFAEFRAKVLADENTSTLVEGGRTIVNTRSSVDPFLTSSPRRDLREIVWRKFKSRGDNGDANDTKATITAIVRLRAERARLLGFPSHAHWRMADTMAADPKTAQAFLLRVWPAVVVAREGRSCRDAGDRRSRGARHHDRALGLPLFRREGAQGEIRSRRSGNQAVLRARQHGGRGTVVGRAPVRHRVQGDHRHRSRVSSRRARLGGRRQEHRRASRAVLSRQLRAERESALARGRRAIARSTRWTGR